MSTSTDSPSLPKDKTRALAWLLGTAGAAATTAQADLVEIDLIGNKASFGNGITDSTDADLTGDGIDDLTGQGALSFGLANNGPGLVGSIAGFSVGAFYDSSIDSYYVNVGSFGTSSEAALELRRYLPVTFTDSRINGGAPTEAVLQVLARNISANQHEIQLLRLIFDEDSPEFPRREFSQETEFPDWVAPTVTNTGGNKGDAAKLKLKRQIAALEAKIRKLKASTKLKPRLIFYSNPALFRQIQNLERRLAGLKRTLQKL